jgi:hypothetical protein
MDKRQFSWQRGVPEAEGFGLGHARFTHPEPLESMQTDQILNHARRAKALLYTRKHLANNSSIKDQVG